MMVTVIGIVILHLLGHNKEFDCEKVKTLHREFVVQNIGNSLPAETLLTEMLGQNGSRHFLQVSHTVDRNTIADYLLKIRGRDILCFPDLIRDVLKSAIIKQDDEAAYILLSPPHPSGTWLQ